MATVANKKALFVMLVDRILLFDAYWSHFFAEFDWFFMFMSRLDAYISRNGDFCANDDDTTDYFTPCACARGNNIWPIVLQYKGDHMVQRRALIKMLHH